MLLKFIKENKNWKELLEADGIKITEEILDNELYGLFKYDFTGCKWNRKVHDYCRGSIINLTKMTNACVPFKKFWNYGEHNQSTIDWASARIEEKLDGSIIKIWHNGTKWIISTNGMIDSINAGLFENSFGIDNFHDLVRRSLENYEDHAIEKYGNAKETYVFEVCTPLNKVVVTHEDFKLVFLGRFDNETTQELDKMEHEFSEIFDLPKVYEFKTIKDVVDSAKFLPFNEEGYVMVDKDYNRLKVKSPQYIAVHRLGAESKWLPKSHFEIVKMGEISEVVTYYSELEEPLLAMEERIGVVTKRVMEDIKGLKEYRLQLAEQKIIERKKDLALHIQGNFVYMPSGFSYINGKWTGVRNFIASIDYKRFKEIEARL